MKHAWALAGTVIVGALLGAYGCGSKSQCDQADDVMAGAWTDECHAQTGCCYCTCYLDGGKVVDTSVSGSCACKAPYASTTSAACTGDLLTSAKACLADETACRDAAKSQIDFACQ